MHIAHIDLNVIGHSILLQTFILILMDISLHCTKHDFQFQWMIFEYLIEVSMFRVMA